MNPAHSTEVWCFEALDTLFFKESRPLEAIGGAELSSTFPPPARTMIGAIRTILGDAYGVHWPDYGRDAQHALRSLMGSPEHLGPLSFQGPYLLHNKQRLYPAPLLLMYVKDANDPDAVQKKIHFTRLQPAKTPVHCDLGWVRLPQKSDKTLSGVKPAENHWLTATGLQAVLQGQAPQAHDIFESKDLFNSEERLGIARDEKTRRPLDGLLYQTCHIRPKADTALGITVQGLQASAFAQLPPKGVVRLGAEGRLAAWGRLSPQAVPKVSVKNRQLVFSLLTHANFAQGWIPDGFVQTDVGDAKAPQTVWQGTLAGKKATLVSAVTGKPVREGGWDIQNHQPRMLQGLVPAGSCYFFEFDTTQDAQHVAQAMHGAQWGLDTSWGRGHIAVGIW